MLLITECILHRNKSRLMAKKSLQPKMMTQKAGYRLGSEKWSRVDLAGARARGRPLRGRAQAGEGEGEGGAETSEKNLRFVFI